VPALNIVAGASEDPATNVWSGGTVFLASMALMIGLSSLELWKVKGSPSRVQLPMAATSGLLAVFYLLRCLVFVAVGPDGQVFRTVFGSAATTLLTMTMLVVVSFTMAALSAEQVTAELRVRASQDGLTGLLNRSAFGDLVQDAVKRLGGHDAYGSLVMADLDHFKALNDTNGHAVGDAALRAFAAACQSCTRATDLVARYGGEEFLLFLPGAAPEQAVRVAEQISTVLREQSTADLQLPTVSYGISAFLPSQDLPAAIASADAALYRAKAAGRNRAVLAGAAAA
jgi:diguanylate cyclase (GGDEF)-like protein